MLRIPLPVTITGCLFVFLIGTLTIAADIDDGAADLFNITLRSKMDIVAQGKVQKVDAETDIYYTWTRNARRRVLSIQSLMAKVGVDGKPLSNGFMSRAKITQTEQGETQEVLLESATEELKQMLQDSFDSPVCEREVDDNGREVKRTVVAGPGAKDLIDSGIIANALLFHPPFLQDQNEWQAQTEVSMGNGGYATGRLSYTKTGGAKIGQTVKVSGTLTNESFKKPGTPVTIKNASYVVRGEQTYDPSQQAWVSGEIAIDVSFQLAANDRIVSSAKGTISARCAKLRGATRGDTKQ